MEFLGFRNSTLHRGRDLISPKDAGSSYHISTREGPVSGNQEAAMIFIKYIYDIVLEISFLDINSQNWIDGGHFEKKLQW